MPMLRPTKDDTERLLAAVLRRDERAWSQLIESYRALIFRCIQRGTLRHGVVLSAVDMEEIFSELCLSMFKDNMRRLRAFDPTRGMQFGSWLGMLAVHATCDFLRSRGAVAVQLDDEPEQIDGESSALEQLLDKERWLCVGKLLDCFSERDRYFVELLYGDGLEPDEIAGRMQISLATVYSKKHKVQVKLEALWARAMGSLAAESALPAAA